MTATVPGTNGAGSVRITRAGGGRAEIQWISGGVTHPPMSVREDALLAAIQAEFPVGLVPLAGAPAVTDAATAYAILSQYENPAAVVGSVLAARRYLESRPQVDPATVDLLRAQLAQLNVDLTAEQAAELAREFLVQWQSQQQSPTPQGA